MNAPDDLRLENSEAQTDQLPCSERSRRRASWLHLFMGKALHAYSGHIKRRPKICLCSATLLYLVGIAYGFMRRPIKINFSMNGLVVADTPEFMHWKAYSESKSSIPGRPLNGSSNFSLDTAFAQLFASSPRGSPKQLNHTTKELLGMSFHYVPRHGHALEVKVLEEIKKFEQNLHALDGWRKWCTGDYADTYLCKPGLSFVGYAWPSVVRGFRSDQLHRYRFDGLGPDMMDLKTLLTFLETSKNPVHDPNLFFPSDVLPLKVIENSGIEHLAPEVLSSTFGIGIPEYLVHDFMTSEVFPYFYKARDKLEHIEVWLYCGRMRRWELTSQIFSDGLMIIGSVCFFLAYMTIMTGGSIILSILTSLVIVMSLPIGYVLLRHPSTAVYFGFVAFLIVGIGADDAFVFLNNWKQSKNYHSSIEGRLEYVIAHSGSACLVTSIATSVSFFGNMTSALFPLREMGFFAGMCVMSVLMMLAVFLPPMLVEAEKWNSRRSLAIVPADEDSLMAAVPKKRKAGMSGIMARLGSFVALAPKLILLVYGATNVLFFLLAMKSIKLDFSQPPFFPDSHNYMKAGLWKSKANVAWLSNRTRNLIAAACTPGSYDKDDCSFFWCESPVKSNRSQITCQSRLRSSSSSTLALDFRNCSVSTINKYFVSQTYPSAALVRKAVELVRSNLEGALANLNLSDFEPRPLEGVFVYEDWGSGITRAARIYDTGSYNISRTEPYAEHCQIDVQCSLGEESCEMQGWQKLGTMSLDSSLLQVSAPPDVQSVASTNANTSAFLPLAGFGSLASLNASYVHVVWGVIPARSFNLLRPMVSFFQHELGFEPSDPWAQRSMLSLCNIRPDELEIEDCDCWMSKFRRWLLQRGDRFPSRWFNTQLEEWIADPTNSIARDIGYDWTRGKITASSIRFQVGDASLEKRNVWNAFLTDWNARAPLTANWAFATSHTWQKLAMRRILVTGTIQTIAIVCLVAILCVLASTFNLRLSITNVMLVMSVNVCLLFIMICICGWAMGPLELLGIIAFVGYATTYPLHIAVAFTDVKKDSISSECEILESMLGSSIIAPYVACQDESIAKSRAKSRRLRTIVALYHIGGPIVSSTVTTVGASAFLLPCQTVVFRKMGIMLISVSFLACGVALIILPAILMVVDFDRCSCCTYIVQKSCDRGRLGSFLHNSRSSDDDARAGAFVA